MATKTSFYNPAIHHRKSIRLKGYDYSQEGLYFITICVQHRQCLFGHIADGEMVLNDAGTMATKWYWELENKFPDIVCREMVVMPNHFHCIIHNVGADLRVCPQPCVCPQPMETALGESVSGENAIFGKRAILGEHVGSPLHRVVQWYKTMTTNEYIRGVKTLGWQSFPGKLWQRNYWEHIIRNEEAYQRIAEYILRNPEQWNNDTLNSVQPE